MRFRQIFTSRKLVPDALPQGAVVRSGRRKFAHRGSDVLLKRARHGWKVCLDKSVEAVGCAHGRLHHSSVDNASSLLIPGRVS